MIIGQYKHLVLQDVVHKKVKDLFMSRKVGQTVFDK